MCIFPAADLTAPTGSNRHPVHIAGRLRKKILDKAKPLAWREHRPFFDVAVAAVQAPFEPF
jgi:hypothetical protein